MKLERLHEHLTTVTAVIIGGLISFWFGSLAGEGSVGTIVAIIAGFFLTGLLLSLRSNVWILLPLTWPLSGQLPQVKFHPAVHDVIIAAVLLATLALMAVKAIRFKPRLDAIGFWVYATLLYLLITWVRHPTGGLVLNSDRIGGRAYINTAISVAAYFILSRAALPTNWNLRRVLYVYVACWMVPGLLGTAAALSTRLASRIAPYYGGIPDPTAPLPPNADPITETTGRRGYLLELTLPLVQWMNVKFRPLTLLSPLFPIRGFFFAVCLLLTLMSGFRSILLMIAGLMLIASYLRRGVLEAVRLAALGVGAAALVVLSSYFVELPRAIQRSFSFLPGKWDAYAVAEAEHSTQWRLFMWKEMLFTDRYIENKWLGDGFGFTLQQYELMLTQAGQEQAQENFLIVGEVHSGPITAIRYVGYLGLLLYTCLLVTMAREALRLCRQTMKTEMGALTWLICLPIIWETFSYFVIFGSYDSSMPVLIFNAGMLKMLRRSLEIREVKPDAVALPARLVPRLTHPMFPSGAPRPITVPLP